MTPRADAVKDGQLGPPPEGARSVLLGTLTLEQQEAADALMLHDTGVLAATTAFGKTVVACRLIAQRNTNTLVLVHRQQLLDQWVARLRAFLDVDAARVGVIRGGRKRPSLSMASNPVELGAAYGARTVEYEERCRCRTTTAMTSGTARNAPKGPTSAPKRQSTERRGKDLKYGGVQ